jgi:hypothetical protein
MRLTPVARSLVFLTEKPPLSAASDSEPSEASMVSEKAAPTSRESRAGPNSAVK